MNQITTTDHAAFWTGAYGAFRWDKWLGSKTKQWNLISLLSEYDSMRGITHRHIDCVVDDFGDLVAVQ